MFFIGRARLRHCAVTIFEFFSLLCATHVGELYLIMAKPVPYESHPELTSQFWRCCLKYCLDFNGHLKHVGIFFSILNWKVFQRVFWKNLPAIYILKQNETKTWTWNIAINYTTLKSMFFLCYPCWCKSDTIFPSQNVIK